MRFGELKSIAHNFADSISSGVGLPVGVYGRATQAKAK
jgi:hypothetical protein